jgi:hypothetical protein
MARASDRRASDDSTDDTAENLAWQLPESSSAEQGAPAPRGRRPRSWQPAPLAFVPADLLRSRSFSIPLDTATELSAYVVWLERAHNLDRALVLALVVERAIREFLRLDTGWRDHQSAQWQGNRPTARANGSASSRQPGGRRWGGEGRSSHTGIGVVGLRAGWKGPERPADRFARCLGRASSLARGDYEGRPRGRPELGRLRGELARSPRSQVPKGSTRMGVAMGFPSVTADFRWSGSHVHAE